MLSRIKRGGALLAVCVMALSACGAEAPVESSLPTERVAEPTETTEPNLLTPFEVEEIHRQTVDLLGEDCVPGQNVICGTDIPVDQWDLSRSPYFQGKAKESVFDDLDDNGIAVTMIHGESVYHPVGTAWTILPALDSYVASNEQRFLDVALANYDYLRNAAVEHDGGLWFEYQFEHRPGDLTIAHPWVSGMAQGMLLSCASNLYLITGESRFLDDAKKIYATYYAPRQFEDNGQHWFTAKLTDSDFAESVTRSYYQPKGEGAYLFFEEYPTTNPAEISHVVNGDIYSMWGVFDFYRVTRNPDVAAMFAHASESLLQTLDAFRVPGEASWYAMTDVGKNVWTQNKNYHVGVTYQFTVLARLTGDHRYTDAADLLREDYTN